MTLSKEQLEFLNLEFSITEKDMEDMTEEQWFSIREKSFLIEAEEVNEEGDGISERGEIAASIADVTYRMLINK